MATADPPPRPLRADAERNRRRLIEAAAELFAAKGLSVGLDEIARHAGVGVGTAYRRFPDKQQLIDALFEQRVGEIAALADAALEREDAWAGLVDFMRGWLELQLANRGLKELVHGDSRGAARVAAARERIAPRMRELVRRAHESGALREGVEPSDLAVLQFLLSGVADLHSAQARELWPRWLQIVLDGLRAPAPEPLPGAPLTVDEAARSFAAQPPSGGSQE